MKAVIVPQPWTVAKSYTGDPLYLRCLHCPQCYFIERGYNGKTGAENMRLHAAVTHGIFARRKEPNHNAD